MIIEEILQSVEEDLQRRTVEDIRIGLGYTAVKLHDGACGLAATMRDEISSCCTVHERAGDLSNQRAHSLAKLALSTDILESALGIATINAILSSRDIRTQGQGGDILENLAISKSDSVGMVGYFEPLIRPIQERCKKLYIFERRPSAFGGAVGSDPSHLTEASKIYPDWAVDLLLPKCSVVIISGTTVLNKTIDHLLDLCQDRVAIVGPTTPLSTIFAGYGVSFLFGSRVIDADRVLKIISEGGGTRAFGSAVLKVTVGLKGAKKCKISRRRG